ncbi:MAG: hypothetical protein U9N76_00965 [Candidatus Marinimicrobia bacterium]|nr:hypothetical protein [Candidatus Neomarinimicrobiota bacterium]
MKGMKIFVLSLLITITSNSIFAFGISYLGEINPIVRYQTSDNSLIELPFRISKLDLNIYHNNIELQTNVALETRYDDFEATEFQLRELYFHWYPKFGEVKIGKIIHAWGLADQNNPTDNLNPYNFYYLFGTGVDRKIGSWSGTVSIDLGNFNIESVFIPVHNPNTLPLNETDLPIATLPDSGFKMLEIENPYEYGIRLRHNILGFDYSISYLHCYDRNPTNLGITKYGAPFFLGYKKNDIVGLDILRFVGDFTIRAESAYFFSSNFYDSTLFALKFKQDVQYLQYVIQVEYDSPFDIKFTTQFMQNYIVSAEGSGWDMQNREHSTDLESFFIPGVGIPFLSFMKRSISLSATKTFFDDRLELKTFTLLDLEELDEFSGQMISFGSKLFFWQNFEADLSYLWIIGNDDPNNFMTKMENFSHLSLGFKYSF